MVRVDPAEVQGNILRSYGKTFACVRHLVLTVADPARARAALGNMISGDRGTPEITMAAQDVKREAFGWCLNVGITYQGLEALGVPERSLRTFPREFREGMAARASWLGDVGESAPKHWQGGLGDPAKVHLVVTVHGHTADDIEPEAAKVVDAGGGEAFTLASPKCFEGAMFGEPHEHEVHFGFRDGLSNVRFEGVHDPDDHAEKGPRAPAGVVLLGHPTTIPHVLWRVPEPCPLGFNGSFNAFRVLRQDVHGFEEFLRQTAARVGCSAGEVAAKMCGRWRNGVPLSLAATEEEAERLATNVDNHFGYLDDPDGAKCPVGSHIRRCNPRDANIVQRGTNNSRLVVRRGMPYGPRLDPAAAPDHVPRGLLGNFICASLAAQFEALQFSWLNLGLQDPRITGTNDPFVGANEPETARFEWQTAAGERAVAHNLPNFVRTEGGAYCFLPSRTAVRWIATEGRMGDRTTGGAIRQWPSRPKRHG